MNQFHIVDAAELARAYATARYIADLGVGTQQVVVGERAAELETAWPADTYAFITAWNPASVPHDARANQQADARLCARLDESGAGRVTMHAEATDGSWKESGWLVAGLDCTGIDALAREFGQAGVLYWPRATPVRLRMLLKPRHGHTDLPDIDWVE